jgi:hypothetical protein
MTTTINASTSSGLVNTADTSGILALQTANTTALTITAAQNVGIGTATPTDDGGYGKIVDIYGSTGGALYLHTSTATNYAFLGKYNSSTQLADSGSNGLTFATASGSTPVERMRIDSSGNLLVAKTTGTAAGINAGSIQGGKEIISCGTVAGLAWENRSGGVTSSSNWYMWYTSSGTIYLYNGTGNAASINPSTGVYTPLSDVNKKKDFAPSTLGLNAVMQLKPTLYRMKSEDESASLSLGFIAQDVKNVIPEAYVETKNENANGDADIFIGLQSMPIIATLTKAIQELKAINDTQAETINALTARIVALEK